MSITALVWDGEKGEIRDGLELRPIGPDEVLIDLAYAGLCHSDVHRISGHIPSAPLPMVMGHEAVGHVVEAGAESGHAEGDKVVLSTVRECGRCPRCRAGSVEPCGTPPPLAAPPFRWRGEPVNAYQGLGSFSTSTVISGHQAVTIPEWVPDRVAAVLGCAVVTGFGAVEYKARVLPGEFVVVVGVGGIGANVVEACRLAGAARIVAVDPNANKEEYARSLGATDFIASGELASVPERLRELGMTGLDAVFECVGLPEATEVFASMLNYHGRIVLIGLVAPDAPRASFDVRDLTQDKSVTGSRIGSVRPRIGIARLLELYAAGSLSLDSLVTDIRPLTEFAALTEEMLGGSLHRGVLTLGTAL